jgi:hypothetical protein
LGKRLSNTEISLMFGLLLFWVGFDEVRIGIWNLQGSRLKLNFWACEIFDGYFRFLFLSLLPEEVFDV